MFKKVLSLDQALNLTGFAIYNDKELILHGVFNLKDIKLDNPAKGSNSNKNNPVQEKISNIKNFLEKIIIDYEIDFVVLEDIQSQVNINTFKQLSWLQGVLINFLYEHKVCHLVLKPSEWRSIIGVKGRKRVEQKLSARNKVCELFSKDVSEDEADAILIGLASITAKGKFDSKIVQDFL